MDVILWQKYVKDRLNYEEEGEIAMNSKMFLIFVQTPIFGKVAGLIMFHNLAEESVFLILMSYARLFCQKMAKELSAEVRYHRIRQLIALES